MGSQSQGKVLKRASQSEDYVTNMFPKPAWLGEVTLTFVISVRVRINQKMDDVRGVSIRIFLERIDPLWGVPRLWFGSNGIEGVWENSRPRLVSLSPLSVS